MNILGANTNSKAGSRQGGGLFGRTARGNAAAAESPPPPSHWGDHHSVAFVDRYLKPGDHVLDVGANQGAFAVQAARCVGLEGAIDSFEPSPQMRMKLNETIAIARTSQVIVHPRMVGKRHGLGRFLDGTGRFRRRRMVAPGELVSGGVIGVDCVTLDRWVEIRRYALMRLDVAGCELFALEGAVECLAAANPPAILLALDNALGDFGFSPGTVVEWLADRNYETILYNADHHKLEYVDEPWLRRRLVLAVAQRARNDLSRRLADYVPQAANV
jgi:FkbM family methyltransferase